ncbi:MAG: bifunctional diaminohydroxyphosphoribosylaminopyrimidine deaminase/5-amino-6-(5-phosphoribosylamino)uracil reductase RibD [Armatimonadetes bacterium]|nr:bifunctional diaminohydroxyphosphoribosylaminopyrimidine deaminase/5-amino-6-(5-phosphoribosylamino)uracil reductase RibD [Armatimonadota bacterium]
MWPSPCWTCARYATSCCWRARRSGSASKRRLAPRKSARPDRRCPAHAACTTPNPMVGCVVVRDGEVVGEGFHRLAGTPHAEPVALAQAGGAAHGATVYVTLEPCSHFGRTPPCAPAVAAARPARVVVATLDPNPAVSGRGIAMLRDAGIAVDVGLLGEASRRLNEAYFHFRSRHRPLVTLKWAATLDGKIATRTGDSRWISGEQSRALVHRLRARSGAVIVGVGTALADDPLLTARYRGAPRQPLRVVLDSGLRLPATSALAASAGQAPLLVCCGPMASDANARRLAECGVEVLRLPAAARGGLDLNALMAAMAARQVDSLLVEGGGATHAAFMAAGLADRALVFVAPKIVGGADAPTAFEGTGCALMREAAAGSVRLVRRIGDDVLLDVAFTPREAEAATPL